jgi:hypothetical protein
MIAYKSLLATAKKRKNYEASNGAELILTLVVALKFKQDDAKIYKLLDECNMWEPETLSQLVEEQMFKEEDKILFQCMHHFPLFLDFINFLKHVMELDMFSTRSAKNMKLVIYIILKLIHL